MTRSPIAPTRAVFFDVDFTLIRPGPTFEGEGYRSFCARHGMQVDPQRLDAAIAEASSVLEQAHSEIYDPELFIRYARRIIEGLGGSGTTLDACAREIYDAWAACQHFVLYDDVVPAFRQLHADGLRIGLISNTHRCLASFKSHFELTGLIDAAVSSSEHGYMKPHPSIFQAALERLGVSPSESLMVGDNMVQDIEGARNVGMRGVLVWRTGPLNDATNGVPVIRSLAELSAHL